MLKKIIISCALLACISSVHAAVESTMDPKLASSIEKILQRTQDLEKEVVALKTELKQLKEEKAQQSAYPAHHKHHASKKVAAKKAVVVTPAIEAKAPEKTEAPQGAPQKDSEKSFLTDYLPRGHTVVSSPYLGTRPSFDASDLVVNTPSVNGDIRVLQHRQQVDKTLKEQRVPASQRPLLELSGKVEGLLSQVWPYVGKNNFGINLETAEIDLLANVSTWATGFIAIQYDNSPPEVSPQRVANSRFFLEQGYFMIGNLEKFPGYLTMGQFYLPFGLYASNMISAPLTQSIGRILTRAVRIGYLERGAQGTSVTGFIFNSDTAVGSRLEGGADITYKWDGALNGDIGVSFVSNISDSQGMQSTGGPGAFTGFGMSTATDTLVHRVPGIDVHSKLNFKKFGFLAEYVSGLRPFAMQDMSFNGHGATPSAFNLEASYSFDLFNKPASFALGYGQSYQGLALNLAKNRYSGVFNISLFRNTIQSLEYRHDVNYGTGTTASGAGLPITSAGLGRHQDLLLFQMGVYF